MEEVPTGDYVIPLGEARTARAGSDVTIVAWGQQVAVAEQAVRARCDAVTCHPSCATRCMCAAPVIVAGILLLPVQPSVDRPLSSREEKMIENHASKGMASVPGLLTSAHRAPSFLFDGAVGYSCRQLLWQSSRRLCAS